MAAGGKGSAKVTDTDRGFRALIRRVTDASKPVRLTVGIHSEEGGEAAEGEGEGLTMSELGEIHEFGLGVPRRSFIADWADETLEKKKAQMSAMAKAVVQGKIESIEVGLERLGNLYVAEVQARIVAHIPPPLSEITIARKGSSTPLVDTGQLKSAITYRVEK